MLKPKSSLNVWQNVLLRLILLFFAMLAAALCLYALLEFLERGFGSLSISLSLLFGLPFILGALIAFISAPNGTTRKGHYIWTPTLLVPLVLFVGGFIVREGIVCLLMALPLWLPAAIGGSFTVKRMMKRHRQPDYDLSSFDVQLLLAVPAILFLSDMFLPQQASDYRVERAVILEAAPDEIWPHLLKMAAIDKSEGRWNFTQNAMRIPRPVSAIVTGEGEGAVRHAAWNEDISFEEHIFDWQEGRQLRWSFQFPNDSVHTKTDRHLAPDGVHLQIDEGGYRLEAMKDGRTRLVLHTNYRAQTPLNAYAALWGELILGDIQTNILAIIEDRIREERMSAH